MGSFPSCQLSCDESVNRIFRCLRGKGYIRNLNDNLKRLQREMEDLKATQQEVKNRLAREEAEHRQRLESVRVWLTRVDSLVTHVNDLVSTSPNQLEKLCLCGLCSKNVCSSYKYGKNVFLLLEEVKVLKSEGNFEVVSEPTTRFEVEERHTEPTIGQEQMLDTAWKRLMEDGVEFMGLHGMGGVGKTTLFNKIHNRFAEMPGGFDVVIWVVVSQGVEISKLQEDIAKKLNLCDEGWNKQNESDKAAKIHRVLNGKRFVLMLDDIWEKVDLITIGVPFPTRENGCKVAFTTRSQEVCGRMGDHEPMEVKCLEWNEAWELFTKIIGDNTLRRNPNIVEPAQKVAKKCHGLPLALNVIGETMASKTMVQEWEHAIDVLTRSAAEFPDMENKILPILKYSYDSLADEHIKSCFLYCALFAEDDEIDKERLINYWICEGFIGEHQVVKRAMNKGYVILGTLIRANLLSEGGIDSAVKMHDVVRELALWIASSFGKEKETYVVKARVGLCETPQVKDWGAVRRMSLMDNNIEKITRGSKCTELTTLLLQSNNLKNLSGEFIQSMQKLVVLDLSFNRNFNKLPEEISKLVSLQYLDLSHSSIGRMPVGFLELKKLIHLDLTFARELCSVGRISKLSSLRILKLLMSKACGDVILLEELQLLEHLQVLTITISTKSGLEHILGDPRLANCIYSLNISGFEYGFNILSLMSMGNLSELWVEKSHVTEIDTNLKYRESPCFANLSMVCVMHCNNNKDLTWLLFAPNLVTLYILYSEEVEEIINKEKTTNLTGIITPFQKLESLRLCDLPKLESIYWSPLSFPLLGYIAADYCPKLRKLPLIATSGKQVGEFKITMHPQEQITNLEWEDEDTKNRFLPLFSKG
ncbi:unnamed protein product [Microthlaspi erraticum]|uniref:Uncharacterized protein n=1 Tax=Microthlaspi erraticum TaxID=1685480 RepID=A0A6D2IKY8_9BRAS|nr:unnamed protein product [Microthlaspi erraticum]